MRKILICNDDGVSSPLIHILASHLKKYGEVMVCAPEGERSAYSQSIDYRNHNKENIKFVEEEDGIKYYSHPHTPTDSLLYVLDYMDFKPDLVVSGINRGLNAGIDIYYSGTVGIATEAILRGIKAFAISIHKDYTNEDLKHLDDVLSYIFEHKLFSYDYVLNVNMPLGMKKFEYEFCGLQILNQTGKDLDILDNHKVTFTPIILDRTDNAVLSEIK